MELSASSKDHNFITKQRARPVRRRSCRSKQIIGTCGSCRCFAANAITRSDLVHVHCIQMFQCSKVIGLPWHIP